MADLRVLHCPVNGLLVLLWILAHSVLTVRHKQPIEVPFTVRGETLHFVRGLLRALLLSFVQ